MEAITITQIEKSLNKVMSKGEEPYMKKVFFNVLRYFRQVQLAYELYDKHPTDTRELAIRLQKCFKLKSTNLPKGQIERFLENPNSKDFLDLFFYFDELTKVDLFHEMTHMRTAIVERPKYRPNEREEDFLEDLEEQYRKDKEYTIWQMLIDVASDNTLIINDSEFDLPNYVDREGTGNDSVTWIMMLLVRAVCPHQFFDWYLRQYSKNKEKK